MKTLERLGLHSHAERSSLYTSHNVKVSKISKIMAESH